MLVLHQEYTKDKSRCWDHFCINDTFIGKQKGPVNTTRIKRACDKWSASAIHITIGVKIVHNNPTTLGIVIKALTNSFTNIKEKKVDIGCPSGRQKIDMGGFTAKSFCQTQGNQS
jgi:hypothetical protein